MIHLPGLLLGAVGLVIIVVISKQLFRALFGTWSVSLPSFGSILESSKFKRKHENLRKALEKQDFRFVREAFVLDSILLDENGFQNLFSLHQKIIEALGSIEGSLNFELKGVDTLEELLMERFNLLKELAALDLSKKKLKKVRKEKGKNLPEWALGDFSEKTDENHQALHQNKSDILLILERIELQIKTPPDENEIYH